MQVYFFLKKNQACSLGLGKIFLNLEGREPKGVPGS